MPLSFLKLRYRLLGLPRRGFFVRGGFSAVDTHACGEPGRVIVGGVLDVPGETIFAKRVPGTSRAVKIAAAMSEAGVSPVMKVLYVPDYVPTENRLNANAKVYREVAACAPGYEIKMVLSEGPFEDDHGVASHFVGRTLGLKQVRKRVGGTRVEFHTSVIQLARRVEMFKPSIIVGEGQGALIAIGYVTPEVLETAMSSRNVQQNECESIGQAWGGVRAVIAHWPRMNKRGLEQAVLKEALPELCTAKSKWWSRCGSTY